MSHQQFAIRGVDVCLGRCASARSEERPAGVRAKHRSHESELISCQPSPAPPSLHDDSTPPAKQTPPNKPKPTQPQTSCPKLIIPASPTPLSASENLLQPCGHEMSIQSRGIGQHPHDRPANSSARRPTIASGRPNAVDTKNDSQDRGDPGLKAMNLRTSVPRYGSARPCSSIAALVARRQMLVMPHPHASSCFSSSGDIKPSVNPPSRNSWRQIDSPDAQSDAVWPPNTVQG